MDEAHNLDIRYDERAGTFHLHHDWEAGPAVTDTILDAVEHIRGTLPTDPGLWAYIDSDALDRLFEPAPAGSRRANGFLVFDYDDVTITLYGNGNIELDPEPPYVVDTDHVELIH